MTSNAWASTVCKAIYRYADMQIYRYADVQVYRYTGMQIHRHVQMKSPTEVARAIDCDVARMTWVPKYVDIRLTLATSVLLLASSSGVLHIHVYIRREKLHNDYGNQVYCAYLRESVFIVYKCHRQPH
jgi:hypothetical protein